MFSDSKKGQNKNCLSLIGSSMFLK